MKSLRLYSILLEESSERAFSIDEIKIFNLLNREKQNLKSKGEITEYLKKVLGYLGYDKGDSMYYYYLYSLNYRPDGRYEEIKKGEEPKFASTSSSFKIAVILQGFQIIFHKHLFFPTLMVFQLHPFLKWFLLHYTFN